MGQWFSHWGDVECLEKIFLLSKYSCFDRKVMWFASVLIGLFLPQNVKNNDIRNSKRIRTENSEIEKKLVNSSV